MKLLAILLLLFLSVVAAQFIAKSLLKSIAKFEDRQRLKNNPYIQYHKAKMKNDNDYDDYLLWLEKEGEGVPVGKMIAPEDQVAENKLKKLL